MGGIITRDMLSPVQGLCADHSPAGHSILLGLTALCLQRGQVLAFIWLPWPGKERPKAWRVCCQHIISS
jgi:hypothetical protein